MRVLITGASGHLGSYLLRQLAAAHDVVAWSGKTHGTHSGSALQPVDLTNPRGVRRAFQNVKPECVIHTAAVTTVSACFQDPVRADLVNRRGSELLAELATDAGARLIHLSTDMVFDGRSGWYREEDSTCPLSTYGKSKVAAEQAVLAHARHTVVRVSWMYGPSRNGRPSFFTYLLAALQTDDPIELFMDEWRTPLSLHTASVELSRLVQHEYHGILHLGGPERMTRVEMGQRLAEYLKIEPHEIRAIRQADLSLSEPRPADLSLDSSRWRELFPEALFPGWQVALREMNVH